MRLALTAFLTCSAMLSTVMGADASPPIVNELMLPLAGNATAYVAPDDKGGGIPSVARGKYLGVACANVERAGADVRVVMALAPDEPSIGYTGILATDQKITTGTVHVRVPDLPDLAQHTVRVKVYVTDVHGTHTCDAGRVKIV